MLCGYRLYEACASGDADVLPGLIKDLRQQDVGLLLFVACSHGQQRCAELLLKHVSDATLAVRQCRSQTILHAAAAQGHEGVLALVLLRCMHLPSRTALLEFKDETGKSALHVAAEGGHTECAKLLTEAATSNFAAIDLQRELSSYRAAIRSGASKDVLRHGAMARSLSFRRKKSVRQCVDGPMDPSPAYASPPLSPIRIEVAPARQSIAC